MPGELTFAVNIANGVTGLSVTDSAVKTMMRWAWRQLGLRLSPVVQWHWRLSGSIRESLEVSEC